MQHPFAANPLADQTDGIERQLLSDGIWEEARAFLALAKYKTTLKAGEALGVSHPTIVRHVKRLEDVLQVQLVTITRQGTVLTTKGLDVAATLSRIDQEFAAMAADVRGNAHRAEGMVRLSITDGLGLVFVAWALRNLKVKYPGIQIYFRPLRNYVELRDNNSDIMVGFAPVTSSDAVSVPLGVLHYETFAAKSYLKRVGAPTLDNLERHEFLDTERYSAAGEIWKPWRALVDSGRVAHKCDASVTYALLVKLGLGIGLLPTFNRQEPSVAPVELGVHIRLPLYAIALRDRVRARHVRIVFDLICEVLGPTCDWLAPDFGATMPTSAPPGYALIFNLPSDD